MMMMTDEDDSCIAYLETKLCEEYIWIYSYSISNHFYT